MRKLLVTLALLAGQCAPAYAQTPAVCGAHEAIVAGLSTQYQELPVAMGVLGDGRLVEVFARADGSTFSVVVTSPGGQACVTAAGENWRNTTLITSAPDEGA